LTTSYNNYNQGTLANNFKLPDEYQFFNFIIYGGGGSGNNNVYADYFTAYGTSGGGSGGIIKAFNIPYSNNTTTITSITYGVSGGNGNTNHNSYIKIFYSDETEIDLIAGTGETVVGADGSADTVPNAKGGTNSYSNTTSFYNNANITSVNGSNGGTQNQNGTTNNYTVSGSGVGIPTFNEYESIASPAGNPTTTNNTYTATDGNSYTLSSRGGGKTQASSYYGAGGATYTDKTSTPGSAYKGTEGVILYYLS
jgi:hypothetical protein